MLRRPAHPAPVVVFMRFYSNNHVTDVSISLKRENVYTNFKRTVNDYPFNSN